MARWKWRAATGRKAQVLAARQADVIRRILPWQYDRKHDPGRAGLAESPVPVAMLGRTSTLELQDPYGSITRQITSAREWLPDGFYLAAYYWDIESGGLDIEQRGRAGNDQPFVDKGLPRDGSRLTCWPKPAPRPPGSPPWYVRTLSGPAGARSTPSNWNANSASPGFCCSPPTSRSTWTAPTRPPSCCAH